MAIVYEHFENLRERFPEWSALKAHLNSKAGGAIRVVESETSHAVLRYVKGESVFTAPGVGLFRSVVWDTDNNRPLCFAPAKAVNGLPPVRTPFTSVEDFMDGCMIQAFVTRDAQDTLQLATRTQLGANNSFYSSKSFRELFEECLASTPVRTLEQLHMHMLAFMQEKSTEPISVAAVFGSFVIQHAEHRVVAKNNADAHMVHLGWSTESGRVNVYEQSSQWPAALRRLQVPKYPIKMFHTDEEIHDMVRRTTVQNGFYWQGLVFKDGTGTRWRARAPAYMMIRGLRGSEAVPMERFLRLRKDGKVVDYVKHYGEERTAFWNFELTLRARTTDCAAAYDCVHKLHTMKFSELPVAYKPIVHLLHVKYLEVLRPAKETVRLKNVIETVNGLRVFEQRRLMAAEPFVAPSGTATADAVYIVE